MSDTIAALATAPVKSAVGMIRISGEKASQIVKCVFRPRGQRIIPRRMTFGYVYDSDGARLDEALCVIMPGPNSYTGEDTAELYCHGSLGVLHSVLDSLYRCGARPAEPGEFTKRAFLAGRMDLTQAEAVIDLIDSESREAAKNAAAQLGGALGTKLTAVREDLVSLVAHLCAVVDYPEDDIPELLLDDALDTVKKCLTETNRLLGTYERGVRIKNGIPCAIVGKPNVGKSSLLNALAGFERSIVTQIPGTTRDMIEESVQIGGMSFRFQDTAGLRNTDDIVEQIGVDRAGEYAQKSDFILAVFDGSRALDGDDELTFAKTLDKDTVCVINQCDKPLVIDVDSLKSRFGDVMLISAKTGEGIDALSKYIRNQFTQKVSYDDGVISNPRHVDALRRATDALQSAYDAIKYAMTADVITVDLEMALDALGELTGQTVSEDVISGIFSRFCVGK